MVILDRAGEVEITDAADFDLVKTFECGQCFRWDADTSDAQVGGCTAIAYAGVAHGRAARLRSAGGSVFISCTMEEFESVWRPYFDLDRDYADIRRRLNIDDFMRGAVEFGRGIRILRQDKWEALCSFIVSQNNNIPRIKKIVAALCRHFGDELEFGGGIYHKFPSAERLASLEADELSPLRCGYRAEYVIGAARAVDSGALDLDALSRMDPADARSALTRLRGVGDKVASCAMLYGLHMLDSFPLDVWMKRAVAERLGPAFDPAVFHPYAGVAQQYIFHYMRSGAAARE